MNHDTITFSRIKSKYQEMDFGLVIYLTGVLVLLYLISRRVQASLELKRIAKESCPSCRNVSIDDSVLTEEECRKILAGDRIALKKLGGKTSVKKRVGVMDVSSDRVSGETSGQVPSEVFSEVVFLNENYSGGEVRSDGQIIYPIVGRRLKGKIVLQPVRHGEQWLVVVGK